MKPITVLLADDHNIVREGFQSLLKRERDIEVVGEAATGRQAVQLTRKLRPDVVVIDIAMPLLNGLQALRQIRHDLPEAKVIILSAHRDDAYIEEAETLGAAGYLLKQASSHELATAIREVQKGNVYFSPALGGKVKSRSHSWGKKGRIPKQKINRLSSREMEVLQLVAEGKSNKQIAAELGVSFKTVDKHRQHLMSKLNIHDIASLTRYAMREGLIDRDVRESNPDLGS